MKKLLTLFAFISLAFYLPSCKSKVKDADVKTAVEASLASYPGLLVAVNDGVATISGVLNSPDEKAAMVSAAKNVKGVKSVIDNTTVAAPPPPAPVVNATDDALNRGLADALKDNPTVTSSVVDGKIVLKGEITKARWVSLKQTLDKLMSKGYDLTGLTIK